jgi:hypothetical protein
MSRYDDDRDRGGRDRDRDRDRDDRGRDRDRDRDRDDSRRSETRGRDRDDNRDRDRDRDDRGRGRDRDRDDRSERGGSTSYQYRARSVEETEERGAMGNQDYDKLLKPPHRSYKVRDGDNRIRIAPPTWEGAKHYGLDVWVHYNVGPDRASYLCPNKHGDGNCPICAERAAIRSDSDADEKYVKELEPKRRVLVYLVDREAERDGLQPWFMPQSLDKDIVKVSVDKDTREVLPIDHPEDGYDIIFEKSGSKLTTKYDGVQIARRSSPLGKRAWMEDAMDKPLPELLQVYPSEHIEKVFAGRGAQRDTRGRDRDRDDDRDRSRSRDRDDEPRGRDRDREERGRDRDSGRDRDDEPRSRSRDRDDEPTYKSVQAMTRTELEDLIELKRLPIKPREAKDDEDLANWVCEEMKLEKPREREDRDRNRDRDDDDRDRNRDGGRDRDEGSDRMREMRRRREE